MALYSGHLADVYVIAGAGTTMTAEACTLLTTTSYQITNSAHRLLDMAATWLVYDNAVLQTSGYSINYANGKISFTAAPAGPVTITGKYLTAASAGQATGWTIDITPKLVAAQTFSDTFEKSAWVNTSAKITLKKFTADSYFFTNKAIWIAIVLFDKVTDTTAYRAICLLNSNGVSSSEDALIMENVSLTATGPVDYQ